MIKTGTKFFRYIEEEKRDSESNEFEVIRIVKFKEYNKIVTYLDSDGNRKTIHFDDLVNNYKILNPDGIIMVAVVKVNDLTDVMVCLGDMDTSESYAVCRQGIYDVFTNNVKKSDNVVYIGLSVSRDTCPANIDFDYMLSGTSVVEYSSICVYLDDTLDDIMNFIPRKKNLKYDLILQEQAEILKMEFLAENKVVLGCCSSLRELLESNNFMYDFRKCFGIIEVPFAIDEDSESLSKGNIEYIENEMGIKIAETYLIRYNRDIDLKSIKRDYILVSSAEEKHSKIYVVGFDKV